MSLPFAPPDPAVSSRSSALWVTPPWRCALGLDAGTSGVRAAVVGPDGAVWARHAVDAPLSAEPAHWWATLEAAVRGLPADVRQKVQAVAVAGTSGTVLPLDARGLPLAPALLYYQSVDLPAPWSERLQAVATPPAAAASSSLAKLLHQALDPALAPWLAVCVSHTDWLTAALLGAVPVAAAGERSGTQPASFGPSPTHPPSLPALWTERHNALKAGADVAQGRWPAAVQALVEEALAASAQARPRAVSLHWPLIATPGQTLGTLAPAVAERLGLPLAVHVVAGTTDANAAFLASGIQALGEGLTTLGSTLVLKQLCAQPLASAAHGIYSHWWGRWWLASGASNAGGRVLRQFWSDAQMAALTPRLRPQQPTGLDYVPLPGVGQRFPVADPGLQPRLSPRPADDAVFFQGLLEALARVEAQGYRLFQRLGAPALSRVWASGGGTRNPAYQQLRAQALGVPVATAAEGEPSVGAARLAGMGDAAWG